MRRRVGGRHFGSRRANVAQDVQSPQPNIVPVELALLHQGWNDEWMSIESPQRKAGDHAQNIVRIVEDVPRMVENRSPVKNLLALHSRTAEYSWRDGVRFGIPIGKDLEEVHEVVLLLGTKLEIADLTVRLGRRSCLGGRHSLDILNVVEDLG